MTVRELPVPLRAGSFEEWWTRTSALAGPLAKILRSIPEPAVDEIRTRLRDAMRPYETGWATRAPWACPRRRGTQGVSTPERRVTWRIAVTSLGSGLI